MVKWLEGYLMRVNEKAGTFKYGAEEALQSHEGHGKSEHKTIFHQILQLEN